MPYTIIPKESIPALRFPKSDVLPEGEARKERAEKLYKAMLLGNGYKVKVKIIFEDLEGIKAVETTVWETSEDNVLLKGGVNLPVHAVRDVLL
ncbi:MAG: hypothetical protein N2110_04215 [Flavobacteriales bacterium]|nr:hypothetical protein [Flavobacteriales bacterium]MCX7768214.1 hypothetical protein [Flavobacteriales bacterium]MDW8409165.1 hypothetical protein [Flavobacteriales bacterium]